MMVTDEADAFALASRPARRTGAYEHENEPRLPSSGVNLWHTQCVFVKPTTVASLGQPASLGLPPVAAPLRASPPFGAILWQHCRGKRTRRGGGGRRTTVT